VIWLVPLGGLVVAALVLGLAALPVLRRLAGLDRAVRRLAERAGDAQHLQSSALALQQRIEALAGEAEQLGSRRPGRPGTSRDSTG